MRVTLLIIGLIVVLGVSLAWLAGSGTLAHALRATVVEQMSRSLGREVRVERLAGDPLRGIVLDGVRIAAQPGVPGPFFEASRIVLRFRALTLFADLLRGRAPAPSLAAIELHRPLLVLSRGADGRWDLPDIPRQTATGRAFAGTVEVREGRLVLTDAWQLPAAFTSHFERVTGTVSWQASPRLRMDVDAVNTDGRTPALLHLSGTAVPAAGVVDVAIDVRGVSVAHWGRYLSRVGWLRWTGGTVDGNLRVVLSRGNVATAADYRARLRLSDSRAVLMPQQIPISGIEGPVELDNRRVASEGLAMTVGTSPVWVRGEVRHLAGMHLDLAVRSPSLDLAILRRLLFSHAALQLSGETGGEVRVQGPLDALLVEGSLTNAAGHADGHTFADLSTGVQYYGGLLVLDNVDALVDGGRARGYARIALPTREFFLLASLDGVDAASVGGVARSRVPLHGATTGFVAAAGSPGAVVGHARLTVVGGRVVGMPFDRAEAVLGFAPGVVDVDRVDIRSGPTVVHALGAVSEGTVDLTLVASDVNLRAIGDLTGPRRWLAGTADLVGRVTGPSDAPVVVGALDARDGRLGPFPFDRARGPVQIGTGGLQTRGLLLRDGQGTYEAKGDIRWADPERLNLTVSARHIPAQRLLDIGKIPVDVTGTVEGTLQFAGTLNAPRAGGTITIADALVRGQPVDRVAAAFRWEQATLLLDDALLEINASRVTMHGSIDQRGRLALSFAAKDLDVADITALRNDTVRIVGALDVDGTLGGTLAAPTVAATVSSTSLRVNGQPLDRADGTVRYQGSRLVLAPLTLTHGGGTVALSGAVLLGDDAVVDLRGTARRARLATVLGLGRVRPPVRVDGAVDGELTITGRLRNPTAALTAEMADGILGDYPIRHAVVSATLSDHAIVMRSLSVTPDQGRLVGAGRFDLAGHTELELSGQGLTLDLLRPLTGLTRPLGGDLDFTLQLSGVLSDPVMGVSASVTTGAAGAAVFDRIVLQAFYRDGQLHVEQGLLQQERHKVKITGTLPLDLMRLRVNETQPIDLRLSLVDADLTLLAALTERIEQGEGPLAGEIHLTGTPARPRLTGEVTASDGTLALRGLASPLTAVQARLLFAEGEIQVDTLRARAGGGTLALSGAIGLQRFRPDRVRLTINANGAHLQYPPYFDGVADGMLRVDGPVAHPTLSGSMALSHGDLFIPSVAPTARPAGGFDPALDLELASGDELWVNLGRLRLQVNGSVHASGTWQRPRLAGEVESDRGTFAAFNSAFTLTEGHATFAEFRATTPYVDTRAETTIQVVNALGEESRVETVRVFLHIYGTPDALVVDLASDPPLAREEILAGLAGRVGVTRLLRGDEVEAVLQAEVGAAVFGSMSRAMAQAFGLEEFTIVYDAERPLTLRLGKSLVRNLYVTMTSEFGVDPRYVWSLEYRFTPITMMSFSVDNQGTYDIFYRIAYRY